jgi:hypothetical protein
MDAKTVIDQYGIALFLALSGVIFLLTIWLWFVHRRSRALEHRLNELFDAASGENVAKMLAEYLGTVRSTANVVGRIKQEHDQIAAVMPSVIRHVGVVRFSPFHDTGGDQSFALALLDSQGYGVVVTALHSRTDSRLYAKPIERGNSSYSLTPEEREAMQRAMQRESALSAT